MPIITVTLPADGSTADVIDYNQPITDILAVVNGLLDDNNIASLNGSKITAGTLPASALAVSLPTVLGHVIYDHIESGGIWSGDSYGSTRNASMTAPVVWINGRRITNYTNATTTSGVVTARTFTASKDTYVDILDNGNDTATLVYTEVANNAASPTLASNSIRVAIIITGVANILDANSINQGQPTSTLPIVSSVPYVTTDSLGNLISPRDPARKKLAYVERIAGQATASTSLVDLTGVQFSLITPANCYRIELFFNATISSDNANATCTVAIADNANNVQVLRNVITGQGNAAALQHVTVDRRIPVTPNTSYTFKIRFSVSAGNGVINNGSGPTTATVFWAQRE